MEQQRGCMQCGWAAPLASLTKCIHCDGPLEEGVLPVSSSPYEAVRADTPAATQAVRPRPTPTSLRTRTPKPLDGTTAWKDTEIRWNRKVGILALFGRSIATWFRSFPAVALLSIVLAIVSLIFVGALLLIMPSGGPSFVTFGEMTAGEQLLGALNIPWLPGPQILAGMVVFAVAVRLSRSKASVAHTVDVGMSRLIRSIFTGVVCTLTLALLGAILMAAAFFVGFAVTKAFPGIGRDGVSLLLVATYGTAVLSYAGLCSGLYLTVPIAVVQRLGPIAAMDQSWLLTRGHRKSILALLLLLSLVSVVTIGGLSALNHADVAGLSGHDSVLAVLHAVCIVLLFGLSATANAVTYIRVLESLKLSDAAAVCSSIDTRAARADAARAEAADSEAPKATVRPASRPSDTRSAPLWPAIVVSIVLCIAVIWGANRVINGGDDEPALAEETQPAVPVTSPPRQPTIITAPAPVPVEPTEVKPDLPSGEEITAASVTSHTSDVGAVPQPEELSSEDKTPAQPPTEPVQRSYVDEVRQRLEEM